MVYGTGPSMGTVSYKRTSLRPSGLERKQRSNVRRISGRDGEFGNNHTTSDGNPTLVDSVPLVTCDLYRETGNHRTTGLESTPPRYTVPSLQGTLTLTQVTSPSGRKWRT